MREFWYGWWPGVVLVAFYLGLVTQFIWKMIYFPEPIVTVVLELVVITGMLSSALVSLVTRGKGGR